MDRKPPKPIEPLPRWLELAVAWALLTFCGATFIWWMADLLGF